jgi:hypothetical protein
MLAAIEVASLLWTRAALGVVVLVVALTAGAADADRKPNDRGAEVRSAPAPRQFP